jgi:hypothetical protein
MVEDLSLLEKLTQMEAILARPDHPGQIHRASNLALAIAEKAPSGCIAALAYRVVNALNINKTPGAHIEYLIALDTALRSLRFALENQRSEAVH